MQVKVKKLSPDAQLPVYSTPGSACFDLFAGSYGNYVGFDYDESPTVIFDTDLQFEIPENHVMLIFSRSGHGFNSDVSLSNCVGVIDSDYRGEVKIKLRADSKSGIATLLNIHQGDRIAQGLILPFEQAQFVIADELSSTDRGAGGFGSTGK